MFCIIITVLVAAGCRTAAFDRPRRTDSGRGVDRYLQNSSALRHLAATNPLAFFKTCREAYVEWVTDYRCLFTRRERIDGRLTPRDQIEILFRQEPFSVHMRWPHSPRPARRVSYVAGRWTRDGREFALVVPDGILALLAPAGVKQDIHSPLLRSASREPLDRFGFLNTLNRIIEYCELAAGDPEYSLAYVGEETLDGRLCYVFERHLPYTGEEGPYPNRLLVIWIDSEWLVPTACYAYADDEGDELLGSYVLTSLEFNIGLTDEDF